MNNQKIIVYNLKFNPTRLSDLNRMNIASKRPSQGEVKPLSSAQYADTRKPVMSGKSNDGKFFVVIDVVHQFIIPFPDFINLYK